jgi:exosortase
MWSFWTTFAEMANKWSTEPQYSHGYLVPLFAAVLLWLKRDDLDTGELAPNWWGFALLLGSIALRLCGAHFYVDSLDAISILPCLAGLVLLFGGAPLFKWSWPAIVFLLFMVPLPFRVETALQYPLRRIGTESSVYVMQTIGFPALAEGNVIILNESRIGVAEACSGLRMLMIFFALTTAVAMISRRPLWERTLVVFSAFPIALIANVARITITGMLYWLEYSELAEIVFHDVAGWLMMPLALFLLWAEFWVLSRLFLIEDDRPVPVGLEASSQ